MDMLSGEPLSIIELSDNLAHTEQLSCPLYSSSRQALDMQEMNIHKFGKGKTRNSGTASAQDPIV